MKTELKPNDSVYTTGDHNNVEPSYGIDLRTHIATEIMAGICSLHNWTGTKLSDYQEKAKVATMATDALIEALNRTEL